MPDLGKFEAHAVRKTTVAIRNAGDGLSEAMATDPVIIHHGETTYVLLETECVDVQHPPIDRADSAGDVMRKHILRAGVATVVDADFARKLIDEQRDRNLARIDAERGQGRLGEED